VPGLTFALVLVLLAALACSRAVLGAGDSAATSFPAPVGYLEGRVDIGPLQPVERIDAPRLTPPPAACTARGVLVLAQDGRTEVARGPFQPDCTYRLELPAGTYLVQLQAQGIDRSPELPQTVTINSGETTRLDLSIDTGIR
jgi:hypothetical protein